MASKESGQHKKSKTDEIESCLSGNGAEPSSPVNKPSDVRRFNLD